MLAQAAAVGMSASLRTARSVVALIFTRWVGQVLWYVIAALIAATFGASGAADAYFWARRITAGPGEALATVVRGSYVPSIVRVQEEHGPTALRSLFLRHARRIAVGSLLAAGLGVALAPWIVATLAPGFDEETAATAVAVLRFLAFTPPLALGTSYVLSIFNAWRMFGRPAAVARLVPPALLLGGLLLFVPPFGVVGLAGMLVAGFVVAFVALMPACGRLLSGRVEGTLPAATGAARLAPQTRVLPILFGAFCGPVSIQIDLLFASRLGEGSVSVLELGYRLMQGLPQMLTSSLAIVVLAEFSHRSVQGAAADLHRTIMRVVRGGVFLVLPTVVLMAVCAPAVVQVLLQHGEFEAESAGLTVRVMRATTLAMVLGLPLSLLSTGIVVDDTVPRTRILGTAVVLAVLARLAAAPLLGDAFGVAGIALGFSAANLVFLVALLIPLRRVWGNWIRGADLLALARMGVAGALAGGTAYGLDRMLIGARGAFLSSLGDGVMIPLSRLILTGLTSAAVYVAAARLLGIEELADALARLRRRT